MEKRRTVLLDFCETVVDFQSFDPFILYILKMCSPSKYRFCSSFFVRFYCRVCSKILFKLGIDKHPYKEMLLKEIKGISREAIDNSARKYYEEVISHHYIQPVIELIEKLKEDGMYIILLSAGCESYLRYFKDAYCIDMVIATRLEFDEKEICTGKIDGIDVYGDLKVKALMKDLGSEFEKYSFEIGITDSISDMPMLNLCKRNIIVSSKKKQKWAENMEEIVWI